jgi:2-dehydro-3-deoxyphosphogluconate aldolase / (4S)-4-hydroxy-2-oxoglutarate aldolase
MIATAADVLELSPVMPVVTITRAADAAALAEALLTGGIAVIEVTLRSEAALAAIEVIRRECPGVCVGAGTVWTVQQAEEAASAGAEFLVSPGIADGLGAAAARLELPYLPGAQTASEIAHLVARGFDAVKFFPAVPAGGVAALKAFAAVFPGVRFCPTGGIDEASAPEYLRVPAVACVGGSWLVGAAALAARDWAGVQALARRAAALATPLR